MSTWLNDEDFVDLLEFGSDEDVFTAYATNKLLNQDMPHRVYMARKPLVETVIRYRSEMNVMADDDEGLQRISPYVTRNRANYEGIVRIQYKANEVADVIPVQKITDAADMISQFIQTGRVTAMNPLIGEEETKEAILLGVYTAHSLYRRRAIMSEDINDLRENMKFFIHQYRNE